MPSFEKPKQHQEEVDLSGVTLDDEIDESAFAPILTDKVQAPTPATQKFELAPKEEGLSPSPEGKFEARKKGPVAREWFMSDSEATKREYDGEEPVQHLELSHHDQLEHPRDTAAQNKKIEEGLGGAPTDLELEPK